MPPVPAGNKHAERFWEARLRWSRCSETRTLSGAVPAAGGARGVGAGPPGSISPPLLPHPRPRGREGRSRAAPGQGQKARCAPGGASLRGWESPQEGEVVAGLRAARWVLGPAASPARCNPAPAQRSREPWRPGSGSERRRVAMAAGGSGRRGADGGCGGRGAVAAVGGLAAAGSSGPGRSARSPLRPPVPGP